MKQKKLLVMQMKADYSQQHKENKYMGQITLTTKRGNKVFVSTIPDRYARFWNYETKIFESYVDKDFCEHIGEELYCDHYQTQNEALEGHKKACEYAFEKL